MNNVIPKIPSLIEKLRPTLAGILAKAEQRKTEQPKPVQQPEKPIALGKLVSQVIPDDLPKLQEADNEALNLYQRGLNELESKRNTPKFNQDEYYKLTRLREFRASRLSVLNDISQGKKTLQELPALSPQDFDEDIKLTSGIRQKQKQIQAPTIPMDRGGATTQTGIEPIKVTAGNQIQPVPQSELKMPTPEQSQEMARQEKEESRIGYKEYQDYGTFWDTLRKIVPGNAILPDSLKQINSLPLEIIKGYTDMLLHPQIPEDRLMALMDLGTILLPKGIPGYSGSEKAMEMATRPGYLGKEFGIARQLQQQGKLSMANYIAEIEKYYPKTAIQQLIDFATSSLGKLKQQLPKTITNIQGIIAKPMVEGEVTAQKLIQGGAEIPKKPPIPEIPTRKWSDVPISQEEHKLLKIRPPEMTNEELGARIILFKKIANETKIESTRKLALREISKDEPVYVEMMSKPAPTTAPIPEVAKELAQSVNKYKSADEFIHNNFAKLKIESDKIGTNPYQLGRKIFVENGGFEVKAKDIPAGIDFEAKGLMGSVKSRTIEGGYYKKIMGNGHLSKDTYTMRPEYLPDNIYNQIKAQPTSKVTPTPTIAPKASGMALKGVETGETGITTPEQGLIEEAKKYKTVEEFVKGQFGRDVKLAKVESLDVYETSISRKLVDDIKKQIQEGDFVGALQHREANGKMPAIRVEDGIVIDGNHRLIALKELGIKEAPITLIGRSKKVELTTKSQLTDIWNKAHALETKPPISNIVKETPPIKQVGGGKIPPKPPVLPSPIEPELPRGIQKGFLETVETSKETTPLGKATAEAIPEQTYQKVTNVESLAKADEIIAKSLDDARKMVLDLSVPVSEEKTSVAVRLMKKYEHEGNYDSMAEVLDSIDHQLRASGRGVQAASIWQRVSPEGYLRMADKIAEKVKRPLSQSVRTTILKRMSDITKMGESKAKSDAMLELMNYTADNMPLRFGELFESYRYQNMLSGLKTQYRNIESNLFNTFITRPVDLFAKSTYDFIKHPFNPLARDAKLTDAPLYYKQVAKSLPDSITAFKEAFKRFGKMEKYDLLTAGGESTIEKLRRAKTPKLLTVVPRFMEATDKFFSTMIGTGEKARLLKGGMAESEATEQAIKLAEHYLYRERVGITVKDKAYLVRALDGLAELLLKGRKVPVIGKPFSWATPFITTPTNVAKIGIEHSPLGFLGGKKFYTSPKRAEALSKAIAGSLVTAMGAKYAMEGKTTWSAPTDPKEKELFYASGRKPFSVQIGGKWVPMWYFGPYAVAIALPAAVKYHTDDSKASLTDSQFEKLVKIAGGMANFIGSQTPLQGVSGFFRVIEGEVDASISNLLGFTAGQVIPLEGLVRYVNTIIDPVFRKAKGVGQTIMKDLPYLSKLLPAYKTPTGEESKRESINYFLPYDLGIPNPRYEDLLNEYKKHQEFTVKEGQTKKETETTAEGLLPSFTHLTDKQKTEKLRELAKTDKSLADRLYIKLKGIKYHYTPEEKLIHSYGVENGERATALYEQWKKIPESDRKNWVKDYKDRKIITDDVWEQMRKLKRTEDKEYE